MNKKGMDIWISWVLLVAAAITATVFMFTWMTDYAQNTNKEIQRTFENAQECDSVAVEIRACQETSRSIINVNATNRGLLKIDKIIFRLYDANDNAVTRHVNITGLRPNVQRSFPVIRQDAVIAIEAVPVLRRDEETEIVCSKRTSTLTGIGTC
jgi:hypothetical protein